MCLWKPPNTYPLMSTMIIELLREFTIGSLSSSSNNPKLWLASIDKSPTFSIGWPPRIHDILNSTSFSKRVIISIERPFKWLIISDSSVSILGLHVVTFRGWMKRWLWRATRIRCIKKNNYFNKLHGWQPYPIASRLGIIVVTRN